MTEPERQPSDPGPSQGTVANAPSGEEAEVGIAADAPELENDDLHESPVGEPGLGVATGDESAEAARRDPLADIAAQLDCLRTLFESRLSADRAKEEAFERLYEDLEVFRGQAAFQNSRPVFLELILLLDRLEAALQTDQPSPHPQVFLDSVKVEVAEILARRAIAPVAAPDGLFDPRLQRAVDIVETEREEHHNSIAQVVRQGYEQDGQVVRPADVIVHRYTPVGEPVGG